MLSTLMLQHDFFILKRINDLSYNKTIMIINDFDDKYDITFIE